MPDQCPCPRRTALLRLRLRLSYGARSAATSASGAQRRHTRTTRRDRTPRRRLASVDRSRAEVTFVRFLLVALALTAGAEAAVPGIPTIYVTYSPDCTFTLQVD